MEWMSFWTGVMAGVLGLGAILIGCCWWWMRPYMKEVRRRSKEAVDISSPDVMNAWSTKGFNVKDGEK
jgi:hypothetical protein